MPAAPPLPLLTRASILVRLFAIQGSWNYETMVGNGLGFCLEPALRLLPGGVGGEAYRAALARESAYFNTHPYMASVAVGALARVELDAEDPGKIERFRKALCGPLGATGDRLVWASWLPFSALLALLVFGAGAGPATTVLVFLVVYNAAHVALRLWGLQVGYTRGLAVASSLGNPVLRSGAQWVSRLGSGLAGVAIPLAIGRGLGAEGSNVLLAAVLATVGGAGLLIPRLHGRYELWKWSLGLLTLFALVSMVSA